METVVVEWIGGTQAAVPIGGIVEELAKGFVLMPKGERWQLKAKPWVGEILGWTVDELKRTHPDIGNKLWVNYERRWHPIKDTIGWVTVEHKGQRNIVRPDLVQRHLDYLSKQAGG